MNFKIYLGIIAALILTCLALAGLNHSLKGKIEQLSKDIVFAKTQELISSSNLQACNAKIDLQTRRLKRSLCKTKSSKPQSQSSKRDREEIQKDRGADKGRKV